MSTYQSAASSGILTPRPPIETFANQFPDAMYLHEIQVQEFTSMCPKTGMPDFGTIRIRYIARDLCMELKSLKYYFYAFRPVGIFYENIVNVVGEDIMLTCAPRFLEVEVTMAPRGGISSRLLRRWADDELSDEVGRNLG